MNWRKPLIYSLLYTSGSRIPKYLKQIKKYEYLSGQQLKELTNNKLEKLLVHAYNNVPYYHKILKECNTVVDGKAKLENFSNIPLLTKVILRKEADKLYSKDYKYRKPYHNASGGSTGEPVEFIQDREYSDWNTANSIYYKTFGGQDVGNKELRLWGSERDLLEGKERFSIILRNWLYNRMELNAFNMTEGDMAVFVDKINRAKPTWLEAYVQPITEFARFIKKNNLKIHAPKGLLTSAGTLYPEMRQLIEEVFGCRTFNRYGSREVGGIACSCGMQEGLHVSVWNTHLEILDDTLAPAKPGQMGKIYVTTLNNYSMPLIRYDIGDMAMAGPNQKCSCGRGTPVIQKVIGRHMEVFKTKEGKIVPAEFFIHFVGVVYNEGYVEKFQVVQKDYDDIVIRVVVRNQLKFDESRADLVSSIKKVMGQDCKIGFEIVDEIQPAGDGKYLYTISEVT